MDERQSTTRRPRGVPRRGAADTLPAQRVPLQADVAEAAAPGYLLDPRDPRTLDRLMRRAPSGPYEVSEADLVRAIRGWKQRGEESVVRRLSELLVERSLPELERRTWGLRHQPQLFEDAIAGMVEQLLREAQDPREEFMTLNYIHYLHCLAADNFNRVLRQEGLRYRRDEQGRPAGRPQHVPRALMERIDVEVEERDDAGTAQKLADPGDPLGDRLGAMEAERILAYLDDPLDRQIMVLRVFEHLRWDDIARICGKTERTMRLRYEKARVRLREALLAEAAANGITESDDWYDGTGATPTGEE